MDSFATDTEIALTAVRQAAALCERVATELGASSTLTKGDRSPVTVADFGAQAIVSLALTDAFAADPIVGEEESSALRRGDGELGDQVLALVRQQRPGVSQGELLDAIDRCHDPGGGHGRRWVLDPIDGTRGFLRGGQYAIALALMVDGEIVLGVLGCPRLPHSFSTASAGQGSLFVAARGAGTRQIYLNDERERRVRVAATADPAEATFCESVEEAHSAHELHGRIAAQLGIRRPPLRIDSQCKYAVVARGDASIYLRLPRSASYREKIWDHAAGALVVREAGGAVTDADGAELDFTRGRTLPNDCGIVATNGRLHAQVRAAVVATAAS